MYELMKQNVSKRLGKMKNMAQFRQNYLRERSTNAVIIKSCHFYDAVHHLFPIVVHLVSR